MLTYPDEVLKQLHEAELEILDAIAAVCERHGITWYLVAGTALGAARHGGFIPWDDDIDIGMMREGYELFLKVAPDELGDEFELLSPDLTPNYAAMFAKVCKKNTRFWTTETMDAGLDDIGIFVDILPRDRLAADPIVAKRQERDAFIYCTASYLYHSPNVVGEPEGLAGKLARAAYPIVHKALRLFTTEETIRRKFKEGTTLSAGVKGTGMTNTFSTPGYKPLPESQFAQTELLPFEGRMFPVPLDHEAYLTLVYGKNWNELPPVEKRVNHAPVILDFGNGVNVMEAYQE